jgi:hypothetical protein
MIDITTIQTFKIPPPILELQESINTIRLRNETLTVKNDTLQKLLIVSLIIIPLLGFALYRKKQIIKKTNQ